MAEKTNFEKINTEVFLQLFTDANMPDDYDCPLCRDTGWVLKEDGAQACLCKREQYLAARKKAAGLTKAMINQTFAKFRLQYYPEYLHTDQGASHRQLAEKALKAAKRFTKDVIDGKADYGLLFEGEVGRGKSFLAAAIANELIIREVDVRFIVVPEFLDRLRQSYNEGSAINEADIERRVQNAGVLILDDLGAHNFSEWTRNKIFALINYRLNRGLPCVITTNLTLEEMKAIVGDRTVSRILEMCRIYRLLADDDIRVKIHHRG
jgi:DNA replication protein DnaC